MRTDFGTIRDEEKMLAVKTLMPESVFELHIPRNDDVVVTVPDSQKKGSRHECSNGDRNGSER